MYIIHRDNKWDLSLTVVTVSPSNQTHSQVQCRLQDQKKPWIYEILNHLPCLSPLSKRISVISFQSYQQTRTCTLCHVESWSALPLSQFTFTCASIGTSFFGKVTLYSRFSLIIFFQIKHWKIYTAHTCSFLSFYQTWLFDCWLDI